MMAAYIRRTGNLMSERLRQSSPREHGVRRFPVMPHGGGRSRLVTVFKYCSQSTERTGL